MARTEPPAVAVTAGTHDLTLGEREVVKTFRSWDRDEPGREWSGLRLLHRHAEGLAPEPLARREVDGRPAVVMSRLPGCSLGASPLSSGQVAVVAAAMTRLHTAVPSAELSELPTRLWGAAEAVEGLRKVYAGGVGTVGSCLLPGSPAHHRNPPGSVERQAERVLGLLG